MVMMPTGGSSIGTATRRIFASFSRSRKRATVRATKAIAGRSRRKASVTRNEADSITSPGGCSLCW